ncbi:hypothetical protein HG433_000855 [Candidatus Saccharibacteria bacterium]|nr:hypothetical protein [Candidatus Saccharibacteria bacterium]
MEKQLSRRSEYMIYGQPQEVENGVSFAVIGDQGEEITVTPHSVEWLSATYVRFIGSAAIKGSKNILSIKGSQTTYEGDDTMRLVIDGSPDSV